MNNLYYITNKHKENGVMKEFKVGDKVLANNVREGTVTAVAEFSSFPIEVTFSNKDIELFTRDGFGDCYTKKPILKIIED